MLSRTLRVALAIAAAGLSVGLAPGQRASASARGSGLIRVNQVGYPIGQSKRAYLMSRSDQSGASFSVRRTGDGAAVLSGTVGASLGAWSARFGHVYALDFDALRAPGEYTLSLASGGATSPAFRIASPDALYEQPLHNALSYYRNSRDGPDFIPSALRSAPAHLNDAAATTYLTPKVNAEGEFKGELTPAGSTIDASGGWWDAGDYLKFVQTTSYASDLLLVGARDFPAQMGAGSRVSSFSEEARFGVEWLLRMWDERTGTLYYQVGIGAGNPATLSDHDIWRLPQADDGYGGRDPRFRYIRHRPVFRAGPAGSPVSPNLAGRDAAAFALCYQLFEVTLPQLAARCLRAGEDIFGLADTRPRGHLITAIPFGFYPESEWRDDLELGAGELAIALSGPRPLPAGLPHPTPDFYLTQAAAWAKAYIAHAGASGETLNLYDVSGLAHFELVRAMRADGESSGLAVSEAQVVGDLRRELEGAGAQSQGDPFGFGFPWNTADTASHGSGMSVMAREYEDLTGDPRFGDLAGRWLGNVLGANAWGVSLIIGDGSTFPNCPQHQVANLVGSLDGGAPVLAGAVVEGPSEAASRGRLEGMRKCPALGGDGYARFNAKAVFKDNVQSYSTVEPAIDLSASSPLAFAWQISSAQPLASSRAR